MALQIDYFLASSDEEASETLTIEAGPRSESSDVVMTQDIDPGFGLGYLTAVLTGMSVEASLEDEGPFLVATTEDEQKFLLRLDDAVVTRLATVEPPFDDLAARWAAQEAPEDADPWAPRPRDLVDFLTEVARLATRSRDGEGGVYCWLWP